MPARKVPIDSTSTKRATVLDVARLAGVSQGSVSRVLTGKNWVSDALRAQVEDAAHRLGYVPNVMAQNLKSQRTRTIAALVSDMSNPLHGEFLLAAEERLQAAGYLLLVANTRDRPAMEQQLLATFRSGRVDGLIVAHSDEANAHTLQALRGTGLPVVFHDREPDGLGDAVVADHATGAYAATKYLIGLGHRRIAVLSPPTAIRPGRQRMEGHRRALVEAGIASDPALWCSDSASGERAFGQAKQLLAMAQRPTAIICIGTRMLTGVLMAIESAGLRIPVDISLVGIGDTDLVRLHTPPITALRWDIAACGRAAADLMLERLDSRPGAAAPPRMVHLPVELVLRHSCAPPFNAAPLNSRTQA